MYLGLFNQVIKKPRKFYPAGFLFEGVSKSQKDL